MRSSSLISVTPLLPVALLVRSSSLGAFVGMLLGGASPIEAGIVQLVVLVALLAAEAVATVVTIELAVRGHLDGGSPG